MPRYHFHVRDNSGRLYRDTEGQELPNLDAARKEAVNAGREMLGERLLHGGTLNSRQIEISEESGKVLAIVHARDVLFRDGQFRDYSDDVTKSAPAARPSDTKRPPE